MRGRFYARELYPRSFIERDMAAIREGANGKTGLVNVAHNVQARKRAGKSGNLQIRRFCRFFRPGPERFAKFRPHCGSFQTSRNRPNTAKNPAKPYNFPGFPEKVCVSDGCTACSSCVNQLKERLGISRDLSGRSFVPLIRGRCHSCCEAEFYPSPKKRDVCSEGTSPSPFAVFSLQAGNWALAPAPMSKTSPEMRAAASLHRNLTVSATTSGP